MVSRFDVEIKSRDDALVDRAFGIDVNHNHPVVSWQSVYDAGNSFIGVKASEGPTFTDPKFADHRAGLRSLPFVLGWYFHFCRPGDPVGQVHRFEDLVGELRPNERLCVDLEDGKTGNPAVDFKFADTFFTTFLGSSCTDRRPWLYTSDRILRQLGISTWDLAPEIDLILPRYDSGDQEPIVPAPWRAINKSYVAWQYSESLVVPGVAGGGCDASYWNGTLDDLKAYSALQPPPSAPAQTT